MLSINYVLDYVAPFGVSQLISFRLFVLVFAEAALALLTLREPLTLCEVSFKD